MDDRLLEKNDEIEIDLKRVFGAIWHRAWIVILAAIVGAMIAGVGTYFFITPMYQSRAMFYVNNSSLSVGDASLSVTTGDITASKSLVESYIVILKARTTLNDVIDYAGVERSYSQVRSMLSAAAVNETEIFEIVVTGPDPVEAEKIATAITYILPKRISSIIEGTSAKIVDSAVIAASPSSPSYPKNIMIGFMLAALVSVAIIVAREIFDITIRTQEDIAQACKHPVLAAVPNMSAPSRGGYYYGSSGKKRKKKKALKSKNAAGAFIGGKTNFAASEAYKLLRTKVQFSFADDKDCYVIGVSSALAGEGKSLTSVNLAYSLAQLEKKVLLIDCDMRRPSLADKLSVEKMPGLSNYLTRRINIGEVLQQYKEDDVSFHVISAGENPPNPMELLSSARMDKVIQAFRDFYDYIILDLPPVEEVGDAIVAAKIADGILLVVRQDYCDRPSLSDAVRQFEFVETRILGVVMNYTFDHGAGYGKKYGKYKKYYHRYGYRYGYHKYHTYEEAAVAAQHDEKSE